MHLYLLVTGHVRRWLLDDWHTLHCNDYTSCSKESAPAYRGRLWSDILVDLEFSLTEFAACSKPTSGDNYRKASYPSAG